MLAFFAWSGEPKPLVPAPLFELCEKTSKRACFGDAMLFEFTRKQATRATSDAVPYKITLLSNQFKALGKPKKF